MNAQLHEKMLHDLADIYDAEHQFLDAQQSLLKQASDRTLQTMIQEHIQQTEQQIENLKKAFRALGEDAKRVPCKGAKGLVSEGNSAVKEMKKDAGVLDVTIAGAAAKVEHYEIASYRGVIAAARAMGHQAAIPFLEANLRQEEQTAQKLEREGDRLLKAAESAPGARTSQSKASTTASAGKRPARS
jgi:ferritin-like metal-binding protein YciE